MKVELFINNSLCDLKGGENIEVDYTNFDITKIDSRGGARSYSFSLPKTNKNKTILENPEMVDNLSMIPYTRLDCRVYVDGVDTLIRFAEVASVKDSYEVRLYGGNTDFFTLLKDKNLRDLDLSEYDHWWRFQSIIDSFPNDEGYIYPIIDYHDDGPNGFLNNDDVGCDISFLSNAFYVNTLIEKIFEGSGFTLNNYLSDDTKTMVLPYSGTQLERNKDGRRYEAIFTQTTDIVTNTQVPPIPNVSIGWWLTFNQIVNSVNNYGDYWKHGNASVFTIGAYDYSYFRFAERVKFKAQFKFEFYGDGYNNDADIVFCTNLTAFYDPLVATPQTITFVNTGDTTNDFTVSGEIEFETDKYNTWLSDENCLMIFCPRALSMKAGSYIKIKDVEVLENGKLEYVQDYKIRNYCTPSQLLPDITQMEFLKTYMQMMGILPIIDYVNNTVTFNRFEAITDNISKVYDWSKLIDYSESPEIRFIQNEYAQHNILSYKQDGDEPKPQFTDDEILIENTNLELEKDLIELIYAPTNCNLRWNNTTLIDKIGVYINGVYTNSKTQRILNIDRKNLSVVANLRDSFGGGYLIQNGVPLTYFIQKDNIKSLGWGYNLKSNYKLIASVMSRAKIVSLLVKIDISIMSQLDYSIPVFIDEYQSYFSINLLKGFSYTESKSTIVELVKLNING